MERSFVVDMSLASVPEDAYQNLGKAEIEYTQEQMATGKLTQLLVTKDHRKYWMVFAVDGEHELRSVLEGFPLHPFFDYTIHSVTDMVAASTAGVTDPKLD